MSYAGLLTTAAALLQPPGLLLLLGVLAIVLGLLRKRRAALVAASAAMLGLYLLSIGPVTRALVLPLENRYPALAASQAPADAPPQAIVVLGGGRVANSPDVGGSTLNARTLARVRMAARLARQYDLPIVVSGGRPRFGEQPEAALMAESLRSDFGLRSPIWIEGQAFNTAQNASRSLALLEKRHIRRIYLVTSALHMPRAMDWFQHVELEVTPAPCDYRLDRGVKPIWTQWLPRAGYLGASSDALHEYVGRWWKWLRMAAADPEI